MSAPEPPPAPAPAPAEAPADAEAPSARLVAIDPSSAEAVRVLGAAFARYLRGPCPPKSAAVTNAGTWGELDRLRAEAHARGLFRPHVIQRIAGSFSRAGAEETLYAVELNECVANGWTACLDLVFVKGRAKPAFQAGHTALGQRFVSL